VGAEPWGNWVPYQTDVGQALRDLQRDVFTRGEFRRPGIEEGLDLLDGCGFFEGSDEEREEWVAEYYLGALREPLRQVGPAKLRQWLIDLAGAPRLENIDAVGILNSLASEGTASALDMVGVSETPEIGHVAPLPPQDLLRLYGTERPTRLMIEQNMSFYEGIGRGEGVYLIAYQDGRPDQILFAGYSVD
jgi:hypothetical protein